MDALTIISCLIILVVILRVYLYVKRIDETEIKKHRGWIESLPSIISTLGVLGTFIGITKGLMYFDTNALDDSIPELLDGLKTAFFTSLFGMVGSLLLNRSVVRRLDNKDESSEIEKAAESIVKTIERGNGYTYSMQMSVGQCMENVITIKHDLGQIKDDIEEIKGEKTELVRAIETGNREVNRELTEINTRVCAVVSQCVDRLNKLRNDVVQAKDDIEEMKGGEQEVREAIEATASAVSSMLNELAKIRAVMVTATASISEIDNATGSIEEITLSSRDSLMAEIMEFSKSVDVMKCVIEKIATQREENN